MIDYFALALTHALMLLALIRIVGKPELDLEPELDTKKRRSKRGPAASQKADPEEGGDA